jgi:hypothetical protein
MLLQAKVLTTAADWAQAYAELAKEKDALASVTIEKDAQLSVLTKEKEVLANQLAAAISQCTALGNSTGLLGTLVAVVFEALSCRSAHSFCACRYTCDVCSSSGGRCRSHDAAEASSRRRCRARAEARARLELDQLHAATCHVPVSCSDPSRRGAKWRGRSYEEGSRRRHRPASPSSVKATRSALHAADRHSRFDRSAVPFRFACRIRMATLQP